MLDEKVFNFVHSQIPRVLASTYRYFNPLIPAKALSSRSFRRVLSRRSL